MEPLTALEFRVLGPLEVRVAGERIDLGAPKQRALLALLLLRRGETVSADRLIDELWGERAPAAAAKSVQVYVSGLRKVLPGGTLQTRGRGYGLDLDLALVDAEHFEDLLEQGERRFESGDADQAARILRQGLELWRGPPLSDFTYEQFAQGEIARLEELRLTALEVRVDADLALGRHADLVAELTGLVGENPLRERMRAQLMLALYRSGRQAEALEVYQSGRRALVEERGLEPGPGLRELEAAILRQDPELGAPRRIPARLNMRRKGGWLMVGGGAVLALAAAAAATLALTGGGDSVAEPLQDGLAAIPSGGGAVKSFTETGTVPGNVAVGEGAVWMLNAGGSGTVSRIDPRTRKVVKSFRAGGLPAELAAGEGAVWVGIVGGARDTNALARIARIDPESTRVTNNVRLPGAGTGGLPTAGLPRVAVGAGAVWAINPDGSISRIDPKTGALVARIKLKFPAWSIAAGDAGVWFLSFDNSSAVTRIDPRNNEVGQTIKVGSPFLWGIAVGGGSVWATSKEDGLLWRIEPGLKPATRSIDVGTGVRLVAAGEGAVWTGNYIDGTVARIDERTNRVTGKTPVDSPQALAAGAGAAWVTVAGRTAGGPLQASVCGEVASGGGRPDVLIASDLPLQGPDSTDPRTMAGAIRYVLERHGFRAGKYTVGYQSCDVSTPETGGFEFRKCASNGSAYAHSTELVAVIGTYSSFCAEVEIPILNRARGGPLPMISPSNTGTNLTRGGALADRRGEPGVYYPTGTRNFFRVAPREDVQAEGQALLAKQLRLRSVYGLSLRTADWDTEQGRPFRSAARKLGIPVAGVALYDPAQNPDALAKRVARSGAQGVFIAGTSVEGGVPLLKALRARGGRRLRVMVADTFAPVIPDLLHSAGAAAKGVYVSSTDIPPTAHKLTPAGERFASDFGALDRPTGFVLPAAQSAEVVLDAIARSDGSRASVLEELRATNVRNGIIGSFRFDRNGDITPAQAPIFRITGKTPAGTHLYPTLEGTVVDRVLTVPASLAP